MDIGGSFPLIDWLDGDWDDNEGPWFFRRLSSNSKDEGPAFTADWLDVEG